MTATIHIVAGPTASGKSALAIEKARQLNGVVINADALQIYNALPLLTAQPSSHDQASVPHKLYGTLSPAETCSVTQWVTLAVAAITEALENNLAPIVVGGTGFYLKALMQGLSNIPDVPGDIRTRLVAQQRQMGNPAFHQAFSAVDPVMAARLHPNDTQRLIRAWEVWKGTGESLATWQARPPLPPQPAWRFAVTILEPARDVLYQRCNQRFLTMMDEGALAEVRNFTDLIAQGQALSQGGVTQALGFRPLARHLCGEISQEEAITQAQTDTRQYAKRQVTWLRHQIKPADNILSLTRL